MTGEERATLRALVDAELRARLAIPACPKGWSSQYGYKQGCRCDACMEASREEWRRYRAARRDRLVASSGGASACR